MKDSMLLFAPNLNSYRRFQRGTHAPLAPSWGYENRSVAVRVPNSDAKNQRIEYRLGGADANPYLALAVMLAGIHHGMSHKAVPSEPIENLSTESFGLPKLGVFLYSLFYIFGGHSVCIKFPDYRCFILLARGACNTYVRLSRCLQ